DILCVDQRDENARIAITRHIPSIFRLGQLTIIVRDSSGFRECCVEALGNPCNFYSRDTNGRILLAVHIRDNHRNEVVNKGTLTRLWPLQEIILSDKLQFVHCDNEPADHESRASYVDELVSSLSTL